MYFQECGCQVMCGIAEVFPYSWECGIPRDRFGCTANPMTKWPRAAIGKTNANASFSMSCPITLIAQLFYLTLPLKGTPASICAIIVRSAILSSRFVVPPTRWRKANYDLQRKAHDVLTPEPRDCTTCFHVQNAKPRAATGSCNPRHERH